MNKTNLTSVGVFGTAKNTGKTTTLLALTDHTIKRGYQVGLTSIGYDGEHFDNITGLPKPRYNLSPGVVIATAEKTLPEDDSIYKALVKTGIETALGEIWIIQVVKPSFFILAGPTQTKYIYQVLKLMNDYGIDFVFIDGALNRLVPMAAANGVVMATGASKSTDIGKLSTETQAIHQMFQVPHLNSRDMPKLVTAETINGERINLLSKSILVKEDLSLLTEKLLNESIKRIYIPGFIAMDLMRELKDHLEPGTEIVLHDITRFLVSGDTNELIHLYFEIQQKLNLKTFQKIKFYGITVNPYYPLYRFETGQYEPAYVDKNELYTQIKAAVNVPVCDVCTTGCREIMEALKEHNQKRIRR